MCRITAGVATEAQRLRWFIENRCREQCSVGVYTEDDEYTLSFVRAFCSQGKLKRQAKIQVIVRHPKQATSLTCPEVHIVGLNQL